MNSALIHLYGPLSIHTYGVCIAAGVIASLFLAHKSKFVAQKIPRTLIIPLVNICIVAGITGGRLLFIISSWQDLQSWFEIFALWDGGFSVLGSMITIIAALIGFVYYYRLSLLETIDVAGLYAPLVQAFGRIGCFFAGCCYGTPTHRWWAITYTDPLGNTPCYTPLHPTQLYNSILLFVLFIFQLLLTRFRLPAGMQFALGLGGLSLIRFITDFWRGDRGPLTFIVSFGFSSSQLLSLLLLGLAIIVGIISFYLRKSSTQ